MVRSTKKTRRVPDTYLQLVNEFPLKSIHNDKELAAAQKMIDKLLKRGPLDAGAEDYLDALSDLVVIYEDEHIKFDDPSDAEMLSHLMEAKGVNQVQLAKETRIGKSTISEILAGKRKLTRKNVAKLCAYFGVVQGVFSLDLD